MVDRLRRHGPARGDTPYARRPRSTGVSCARERLAALCRCAAPVLRIVVHLELAVDLRNEARARHVSDEGRDLRRQIVPLLAHDDQLPFAADTELVRHVATIPLLAHVIDLELDDRNLVDEGAECLSHASFSVWLPAWPVWSRAREPRSREMLRRCARSDRCAFD